MDKASTADMVKDAIKTLSERRGSSLHNIKKYIEAVYQVDMRYRAPRIRKFLRAAVSDGGLVQTRGRGASGSFKLPPKQPSAAAAAAAASAKVAAAVASAPPASTSNSRRPRSAASASTTSARSSASSSSIASASTASTRSTRGGRARARR